MDPKIAATVLAILLYAFSANNPKPENVVPPSPVDAYEVTSAKQTDSKKPVAVTDHVQASVKELARVRKGPGTDFPTLQKLPSGARVTVIAQFADWYQVKLSNGQTGWMAGFLLEGSNLPALNPMEKTGFPSDAARNRPEARLGTRKVIGYYTEDYHGDPTSYGSLLPNKDFLDGIAIFLHPIDKDGRVIGETSERAMKAAKSGNLQTLALVHNLVEGGFDEKRAHSLLHSYNSRAKAISDILTILEKQGYDGVNIDLENVNPRDRENLTAFMNELCARLKPRGYLVTMSVPAKTQDLPGQSWIGAFDYYALGKACDYIMLMTYDEHSQISGSGPVASFPWVEKVIKYAITQIPRHKVLMGVPAYGYDWNLATGRAVALSYTQVMNRANRMGIAPSWDSKAKSPFFKYVEGGAWHEVWFESPHSLKPKLELVEKYDIGGIAIWKLGYEDNLYWKAICDALG
ncbi:MAG TPA: glycosyl hydrolase family 18 protein [Bacillota bacterium]|nr:glycosyl hydrolase family 18 protein [Bacillota bacterium]